jgi:hypothetical protein
MPRSVRSILLDTKPGSYASKTHGSMAYVSTLAKTWSNPLTLRRTKYSPVLPEAALSRMAWSIPWQTRWMVTMRPGGEPSSRVTLPRKITSIALAGLVRRSPPQSRSAYGWIPGIGTVEGTA